MRLTVETIEDVLDLVYVHRESTLDLRGVSAVDPYALLTLDLAVRHARESGRRLRVAWPDAPGIRRTLTSARFFADVKTGIDHLPAADPDLVLQPIAAIDREENVTALVDAFDRRLADRYPIDEAPRRRFLRILLELFQNIPQHANATGDVLDPHGIATMADDGECVILAIADKGIGLRRSLALRPGAAPRSDADALRAAVLEGASRFIDPGRGQELARIVRRVRAWEGAVAVRSGTALFYESDAGGDVVDVAPFPGVQISLAIPRRAFGIGEATFGERGVESYEDPGFNE
ncbi:MAG: hypothetical protein AB1778_06475 [Candidatus Bipolaricaulota bacterium]